MGPGGPPETVKTGVFCPFFASSLHGVHRFFTGINYVNLRWSSGTGSRLVFVCRGFDSPLLVFIIFCFLKLSGFFLNIFVVIVRINVWPWRLKM